MNKKQKTIEVLKNALKAGETAFLAFNDIACKTSVSFTGYEMEWFKAKELINAWINALEAKEEAK